MDGRPLERTRNYRIVTNNFVADGGDSEVGFKNGRDRAVLGTDIDSLVDYVKSTPQALSLAAPGRIVKE